MDRRPETGIKKTMRNSNKLLPALLAASLILPLPVLAIEFGFDSIGLTGVVNNNITVGGQLRTEKLATDLIGKSNLNPQVCAGIY